MSELDWNGGQLGRMQEAIEAEIENSRLAHKLIPEFKRPSTERTRRQEQAGLRPWDHRRDA